MDLDAILEKVTGIFAGLESGPVSPDTSALIEKSMTIAKVLVIAGPVIMLILGLLYLFAAPREANHHFGYRCYFGMGSEEAWRFTQRLAGFVWAALGLALTVVMLIITGSFSGNPIMDIIGSGVKCLLWEIGLAALSCLGINTIVMLMYNARGYRRR